MMSSNLFPSYKEIPVGSNLNSVAYSRYRTKHSVKGEGRLLGIGAFSTSVKQIVQAEVCLRAVGVHGCPSQEVFLRPPSQDAPGQSYIISYLVSAFSFAN